MNCFQIQGEEKSIAYKMDGTKLMGHFEVEEIKFKASSAHL